MSPTLNARARTEPLEPRTLFTISFADPTTFPVAGDALTQPAFADFNGDGFLDAATCHTLEGQNSVSVLLNNGNGTFANQVPLAVGARPFQVIAADFNNDTKQDLACTNVVDGTIGVLLGNGDGTFQAQVTTQLGATAPIGTGATEYLAAGNLNGDAFPDLVVNNNSELALVTLLGDGDGTFTIQESVSVFPSAGPLALADFSGDGNLDVATNLGNESNLTVYFSDGAGNLDNGRPLLVEGLTGFNFAEGVAAGDFNGDTRPDIAVLSIPGSIVQPGSLSVFLSNGDGTFQPNVNTSLTIAGLDLAAADMDNDGKVDVIISQALTGFQALRGNGDGTFASPDVDNTTFAVSGAAAIGDLDNNGTRDIAFAHFTSATDTLGVLLAGTPGGGGGGGGGGGDTSTVTPDVQATLPPSAVAGQRVKGAKVSVVVANQGAAALNDTVTVELFVSTDETIDGADAAVGAPVVKRLRINPAASKPVRLKVAALPNVPDGEYFLLARTSAAGGATGGTDASAGKVNIAAAFVDLTATFETPTPTTLVPGRRASIPLTVQNLGNIPATGTINVNLIARPAGGGPFADANLPTAPVRLNLKPNATKVVRLRATLPVESLLPGSYSFVASIDSGNAFNEKREDNNEASGGTSVVAS